MGTWLKKLWYDDSYFGTLAAKIWLVVLSVSALVAGGFIPELTEALGSAGAWGSRAILLFRIITLVKTDAPSPAAKALAAADPMLIEKHLKNLGVPDAIAIAAADKTATTSTPQI